MEIGHLDPASSPSARATRARLGEYVQYLRARGLAPITIAGCIRDLREAIRVMEPNADLTVLTDLLILLDSAAEPSRNKRLRVVSSGLLYEAAIRELKRLHKKLKARPSRRVAGLYRDALIMAFLALRPIRLENLSAIALGRHLTKVGDRYWCRLTSAETKEGRPLEFPMPEDLTPWLDHYLAAYRALLLRGKTTERLWISTRSTPMVDNTVYCRVTNCTERLVGRRINPHLFRNCAATTTAEFAPEDIGIVSRLLGHSTPRTAEFYYNQARMISAGRRYHHALEEFRGKSVLLHRNRLSERQPDRHFGLSS
jgi:integrase